TQTAGAAVDIYALGAILYELLTGRPPFQAASVLETLELVRSAEPVPPRRLQPKLSIDLETICLKCLEKEPARRYARALALAEDLERFLTGRPILARRIGPVGRTWRWVRRNPAPAAMLSTVVGLLLVIAIGGVILNLNLNTALKQTQQAEADKTAKLWDSYLERARAH